MKLTELPADVVVLVFPYLSAADFLSFTSSSKVHFSFQQDPKFWRDLTTKTFRFPSQTLLQADGARWKWLYKSLCTQTHVYTWGKDPRTTIVGHIIRNQHADGRLNPISMKWPSRMKNTNPAGIVVDIQCGGLSTVLLNSTGQLFMIDDLRGQRALAGLEHPVRFNFPPGYPTTTTDRYEPTTAIQQYSVGRYSILGLSDAGIIWEWVNYKKAAQLIKFVHVDTNEYSSSAAGSVTRVVAGWAGSSAYVMGTGIVFWNPYERTLEPDESSDTDGYLIEFFTIPGTSFRRAHADTWSSFSLEARVGEVINHVFLENYLVFATHLNKVFTFATDRTNAHKFPVELTTFSQSSPEFQIEDIYGSFRTFGVVYRNGPVIFGDSILLNDFLESTLFTQRSTTLELLQPKLLPALDNASVISLAFGDHHYHAHHANGTISSHGFENQVCGALGLGLEISKLRGAYWRAVGSRVVDDQDPSRKTVWFEPEKEEWLRSLHRSSGPEFVERAEQWERAYGDWFEREGNAWHLGPPGYADRSRPDDESDKNAYVVLKVAAAGWHSAALVLVDDAKAERVREKYVIAKPSPSSSDVHEEHTYAQSIPGEGSSSSSSNELLSRAGADACLGLDDAARLTMQLVETRAHEREVWAWEGMRLLPLKK